VSELARARHLVRRFVGSLSRKPPSATDTQWAEGLLLPGESALWQSMSTVDRRHSVMVARRFAATCGDAPREALAAALLHDVGKTASGLGTFSRVVATIVGPRTERFRVYHDHERIGAEMLRGADAAEITVSLVDGSSDDRATLAALRAADDI